MVTRKNIINAIRTKYGHDVGLHQSSDRSCFHFHQPDDWPKDKPHPLDGAESTSVYVIALYQISLEQWVNEYGYMIDEYNELSDNNPIFQNLMSQTVVS